MKFCLTSLLFLLGIVGLEACNVRQQVELSYSKLDLSGCGLLEKKPNDPSELGRQRHNSLMKHAEQLANSVVTNRIKTDVIMKELEIDVRASIDPKYSHQCKLTEREILSTPGALMAVNRLQGFFLRFQNKFRRAPVVDRMELVLSGEEDHDIEYLNWNSTAKLGEDSRITVKIYFNPNKFKVTNSDEFFARQIFNCAIKDCFVP
jgi:hypothetical protein